MSDRASTRPQPNHTRAHHFPFQFGGFVATVNFRNHFALYRTLLETGRVTIDPKRGISAIGQELFPALTWRCDLGGLLHPFVQTPGHSNAVRSE